MSSTSGIVPSIVQLRATTELTLPAMSVARAAKVCGPSPSAPASTGESQRAKGPPPNLHPTSAAGSSTANAKVDAAGLSSARGADVMVTVGATVSTFQL